MTKYLTKKPYTAIAYEYGTKQNRYPMDKAKVTRLEDGTLKNEAYQDWGKYPFYCFLNRLEVRRLLTANEGIARADQYKPFRITAEQLIKLCEFMSNADNYGLVYTYCKRTFNEDMSTKNLVLSMVRICIDANVEHCPYTTTPYLSKVI